ncbi:MAG: hypothetical protein AAB229_07300 [Candidatus Hydrogenedentota bacterium]|mgnify:CR=1 FL=1
MNSPHVSPLILALKRIGLSVAVVPTGALSIMRTRDNSCFHVIAGHGNSDEIAICASFVFAGPTLNPGAHMSFSISVSLLPPGYELAVARRNLTLKAKLNWTGTDEHLRWILDQFLDIAQTIRKQMFNGFKNPRGSEQSDDSVTALFSKRDLESAPAAGTIH